MAPIRNEAFARVGLIGNPSDGYFGKTISLLVRNFRAVVEVSESDELRIESGPLDQAVFDSMSHLAASIRFSGYYGGVRLIKAAIMKFHEHLVTHASPIADRNFTLRYDSDIPLRVGLAGSSAIITATIRALMEFYEVEIPKPFLPTLILRVESEELGIGAGLQDRVVQVYGGCVYMDFEREHMEEFQYGVYEELDPSRLPPLYLAYRTELSEGTEVVHNTLRSRWDRGDRVVRDGIRRLGEITDAFYVALREGDAGGMSQLMNQNFDVRAQLCAISDDNWALINAARNAGASAKFAGSGGAIIGTYDGEGMFEELREAMAQIGAELVKPVV